MSWKSSRGRTKTVWKCIKNIIASLRSLIPSSSRIRRLRSKFTSCLSRSRTKKPSQSSKTSKCWAPTSAVFSGTLWAQATLPWSLLSSPRIWCLSKTLKARLDWPLGAKSTEESKLTFPLTEIKRRKRAKKSLRTPRKSWKTAIWADSQEAKRLSWLSASFLQSKRSKAPPSTFLTSLTAL